MLLLILLVRHIHIALTGRRSCIVERTFRCMRRAPSTSTLGDASMDSSVYAGSPPSSPSSTPSGHLSMRSRIKLVELGAPGPATCRRGSCHRLLP
jgi:hypothetical protein